MAEIMRLTSTFSATPNTVLVKKPTVRFSADASSNRNAPVHGLDSAVVSAPSSVRAVLSPAVAMPAASLPSDSKNAAREARGQGPQSAISMYQ
jgi:hypothetical protein